MDEIEMKFRISTSAVDVFEVKFGISISCGWNWNRDEIEKKLMSNLGEQTIQGDAKSTSISILSEIHQTDWGKQFNELSTTLF